jgi:S-adenosylmethionine decarboxylase
MAGDIIRTGVHAIADFYECSSYVIGKPVLMLWVLRKASELLKTTIVAESVHKFSPQGMSITIIISESHLAVHTFPELDSFVALDIYTCGEVHPKVAVDYIIRKLKCKKPKVKYIKRGKKIKSKTRIK